jgi:acyl-CoA synthetase (AMP-forming)/AMP-acid ligase II
MKARSLLQWLEQPSQARGIHFAVREGGFELCTYAELAADARRVSQALSARGVEPGDVVVLVLGSGKAFVSAFFGTLLAGATPAPVARPAAFQAADSYTTHLGNVLRAAQPQIILTEAALFGALGFAAEAGCGARLLAWEELGAGVSESERPVAPRPELGVLQFTSGSTARPRGVGISLDALERNIAAIVAWFGWSETEALVSWLPVHHDMGLIAGLLLPITLGADLYSMAPEVFLRRPGRWLDCLGDGRAVGSVVPPFAFDYVLRKLEAKDLQRLDFSRVRAIMVGAERIPPGTVDRFVRLLAPRGLSAAAIKPVYGLAEATLCVTACDASRPLARLAVAPESLVPGARVVERDEADGGQTVVGCGRPIADQDVRIEYEDGEVAADLCVGEIVVRGPCLARGYHAQSSSSAASGTKFRDGALRTGDAGFTRDKELFVLGRFGDSLKIRGRFVFAEQIEAALADAGLATQGLAVSLGTHDGVPTALAVLERPGAGLAERARQALQSLAEGARAVIIDARPGTITRTSSGKPKRAELFAAFVRGRLAPHGNDEPRQASSSRETEDRNTL